MNSFVTLTSYNFSLNLLLYFHLTGQIYLKKMKCSGRSCKYTSETPFDICPECHMQAVRCIGRKKRCGRSLYTDENFCPSCGREVPATCQWMKTDGTPCNTRLKENAVFCHKCGQPVWSKGPGWSEDSSQSTEEEPKVTKDKPNREIVIDPPGIEEMEKNAARTKWTLKTITNPFEILKIAMQESEPLKRLFLAFFQRFRAIFRTLSDGCLEFCFLHENTSAAQNMMDRRKEVLAIFQQFLEDVETDIILQESDVEEMLVGQGEHEELQECYDNAEKLKDGVNALEKATANTEKMILLLSSDDRKSKMIYLSWETETLRLFDIYFKGLLSAHQLPTDLALDVKHSSADEHDRDRRLETEDYMRHVLQQLKRGIDGRRDLFPLLGDMMRQVKDILPYLQAKTDYLELATSGNLQAEDREKQTGVPVDEGLPSLDHEKHVKQTDKEDTTVSTKSSEPESEEILQVQGGKPGVSQSRGDDMNEVTDSEKTEDLKKKLETLKTEADRKQQELREVRGAESGVEWEYNKDCLSKNMAQLRIQDFITDVIGEDQMPVISDKQMKLNGFLDGGSSTRRRGEMRPCLIYHLRKLQFGKLRQKDLMDIARDVITVDQERLTNLRTQSDRLERVYGSPIYIVGKIDTDHSGPVSCPPMTFNRERVSKYLTVSGDGLELVNSDSGDHHDDQFRQYWGTCSRLPIPFPLSPSTPTVPQYWETHSRVQVGGRSWPLLEMGVCGEREVNTESWVSYQNRSSWSVCVRYCREHDGHYCTHVWENGGQVGGCHDTVSRTPGTDLIYKLGIALDMGRGRLAFLDVKRGCVLHRLDIKVDESLVPMFCVAPTLSDDNIKMGLVSGSQLPITDTHKHLIAKAFYSP